MNMFKKTGGFTLVELIVVIAILAILAGVAVPAYSGYIAKANETADQQLLAAANTAINAACSELGIPTSALVGTQLKLNSDKTYKELAFPASFNTSARSSGTTNADKVEAAFEIYFGDNKDSAFKVYVQIVYGTDGFVGYNEDAVIEVLKEVISGSNFNGKLEELTGDVAGLVGILGDYLDTEGVEAIVGTGFDDYLTNVLRLEDKTDSQMMANAAVLYLAHSAANMSEDNVLGAKTTLAQALGAYAESPEDNPLTDELISSLAADTDSGLASYAMLYATAEAIAMKEGPGSAAYQALQSANPTNPASVVTAVGNVFNAIEDKSLITDYIGNGEGSEFDKDMDAYFQTLQAMNSKESELKDQLDSEDLFTTENETIKNLLDKLQG